MIEQYSEKVMEHFKNPRNVGEINDADGVGHERHCSVLAEEALKKAIEDCRKKK